MKGIKNITDLGYMFSDYSSLLSLPDILKLNTPNATNMRYMFNKCSSLLSLLNISKWKASNVINMKNICLVNAHHYYLYLIFQNGIHQKLLI